MIDVKANRSSKKYSSKIIILRVLWAATYPIFRLSPRLFHGWRVLILKIFGSKIGKNVHIYPSAKIYFPWNLEIGDYSSLGDKTIIYNLGKIIIGSRVTVSQYAHLCAGTHNYRDNKMTLIKSKILIDDDVWVCANTIIGPDTRIGTNSIVGIGSVVTRDVEMNSIYAGNPAVKIKDRGSS